MLNNKTLLITTHNIKQNILLKRKQLTNIKIMSLEELISKLTFTYNNEAIYYLIEKYKFKYEVARIYLDNLKYIENKKYFNNKLDFLVNLKHELEDNNLLIKDEIFKQYIRDKKIIIYGYEYINNYQKKILKDYNYEIKQEEKEKNKTDIYEFQTIENEIVFVATKIIELINNGIDINKIKIINLNKSYYNTVKKIFKFYNIPIKLNKKTSIYETNIGQYFIENIDNNVEQLLENIKEKYDLNNEKNLEIYNKIIEICNNYNWNKNIKVIKEMITYDLRNNYLKQQELKNKIECIDIKDSFVNDEYIFLINFNNESIPKTYKDEDYINDKLKQQLNIETSCELNKIERKIIKEKIEQIKNLIITYRLKDNNGEYTISNLNEELNYNIIKNNKNNFKYSNIYNKVYLASSLDNYLKYGKLDDNTPLLFSNYKNIEYQKYDNKFSGIDKNKLINYLDNKLLLSYSSLDNYNRCGFRYYLNNILKINVYEETFMTIIGNIFHDVLSKMTNPNFDLDDEYNNYIKNMNKDFTKKETYFLDKLKEELRFVVETIQQQQQYISLDKALFEEKIYINKDKNIKITFMGIIDKLLYKEFPDKTLVAIIDYKTGNPNLDLTKTIYGIDIQLPIYIYLSKNTNKFKNVEILGFYLQKILDNQVVLDYKNDYEKIKRDKLKLQGYSNSNEDILKYFDKNYVDSEIVKSLKISSKGFYSYSKILTSKQIDTLEKIVDKKINEAIDNILDSNFKINPKKIGNDNIGCAYCNFKDICYMKEEDLIYLKEYKNLDFLNN